MEFSQADAAARSPGAASAPAKVIQLPLWPEAKRAAPNTVLRGALFAAIQGKGRQYMHRKELIAYPSAASRSGTPGKQLDQADLDVWEQALHLARTQALGTAMPVHGERFSQGPGPLGRQE